MPGGEGGPACLWKQQEHLRRVLQRLQDGRWGQHSFGESFTGHSVSPEPEARSAGAQEAAHGVVAGMVTDSSLQGPPTLIYICGRASLPTAALSGLPSYLSSIS